MMFWRAVSAFLVLPGVVAFVIPWLLHPSNAAFNFIGLPVLAVGVALLLWCIRDFYVVGRGTLAPWSPPTQLVIVGLYRLSRNPMYLAVVIVLCGWALGFESRTLWIYTAFVAVAFHLRVVFGEEPWLSRTYGERWTAYKSRVPRWIVL